MNEAGADALTEEGSKALVFGMCAAGLEASWPKWEY